MADTQKNVDKAEDAAAKARETADKARQDADNAGNSSAENKALKAEENADDKNAELAEAKNKAGEVEDATKAGELKAYSAVTEPDRAIGDHHAQKFSNTPENPPLAKGLDPDAEGKVKLVMETSDTLAAGKGPAVCYVHEVMVQSYLNAGWTRASAATLVG